MTKPSLPLTATEMHGCVHPDVRGACVRRAVRCARCSARWGVCGAVRCVRCVRCGVCPPSSPHRQAKDSKVSHHKFTFLFLSVPYLIFSLFTIKIFFKLDHFLSPPPFFKASVGRRKTAELRHKVELTLHMPHCFLFSFQHSCGWKPAFRIPRGPASLGFQNITLYTLRRQV